MTNAKISSYGTAGTSKSLTQIDGKKFTIVAVEDSDYDDKGTVTKGVKITTEEDFTINGEKWNCFHTTRTAVVSKLTLVEVRSDLEAGTKLGPLICQTKKSANGRDYFDLVDA